jgi:hypothetical protein
VASAIGGALRGVVLPPILLRPIERETFAHQPRSEIDVADETLLDGPPILILGDWLAARRTLPNEGIKIVRGLCTTSVQIAVGASAQLSAFRRVDPPKANARPVNFQRVAVDDARLPRQFGRQCRRRLRQRTSMQQITQYSRSL